MLIIREKSTPDFSLPLAGKAIGCPYFRVFSTKKAFE
jgi:hypothetical protein